MFLTSNFCFWLNYESYIYNIHFPSEKVILSMEKYSMHMQTKHVYKPKTPDSLITDTQLFPSQDVNWWMWDVWITCGSLWCFYQLFGLSFWRHPFTADDPLVSKWCNVTYLQYLFSWRNKLIYMLDSLTMSTLATNFHFGVNYSFNELRI